MKKRRYDAGYVRNWPLTIGLRFLAAGVLLSVAVILIACGDSGADSSAGVNQGNRALNFTLEKLDGEEVSLSDYAGEVVVVNFWATWCPPCRAEIPDLEAAYQAYQEKGLVVLGVNVEDPARAVESFVAEMEMTYPVVLDETGKVMRAYRTPGLPMSVVLDREGVIRARHIGFLSAEQLDDYLQQVLSE